MATQIMIPSALRRFVGSRDSVQVEATTVGEALSNLVAEYRDLKKHLYDEEGRLRSFVNVYVNDEDVRYLDKDDTQLKAGDVVSIVPSIAGGAPKPNVYAVDGLSPEEVKRYSRHLIMPEVAIDGQLKLKGAKVLLIGTGGLGAPAGLYLTAAGVGKIGLVDFDVVDYHELAAPGDVRHQGRGPCEARRGARALERLEPGSRIRAPRDATHQRQRVGHHSRL